MVKGEERVHKTGNQLKKSFWSKERLFQILALIISIVISALILIFRENLTGLGGYGYLGAFLISIICCATIIVPVPGLVIVFTLGAVLNPLLVGLVSGLGATIGEMTGYLLGYGGRSAIENMTLYKRVEKWMKRWGALTIFILALIPNPIFDIAAAVAGALRFPLWKFTLWGGIGRTIKNILFAYAGAWGIVFVQKYFM
jgi:membrane protein YqaA with SNARE-associated domain